MAFTALLLKNESPEMCCTPGPGELVTLPVCSLYPLNCSVAPSSESNSEPASPANVPSGMRRHWSMAREWRSSNTNNVGLDAADT